MDVQVLYTTVLQAHVARGQYDAATALFHAMTTSGVPLDALVFTHMIRAAGKVRGDDASSIRGACTATPS
jgi:pentatricopeptide repeat protein